MTPEEFDKASRQLLRRCPGLSLVSGYRGRIHNIRVGGNPASKHLVGMANDYAAGHEEELLLAQGVANELGLWHVVHDVGSGQHLHIQGLAPGPIPEWWRRKYWQEAD